MARILLWLIELASLSDAAEALRLTAAAPPRPTPSGGDYE